MNANRIWIRRYYLDNDTVTIWKYQTIFKVESCINGLEMWSTVLEYDRAESTFNVLVERINHLAEEDKV